MEPIYIAAIISFVIGLFGYIVVRFWVLPIGRYIRVKRRFASDLDALMDILQAGPSHNIGNPQLKDRQLSLRCNASHLSSVYRNELPYWYRLFLESRKEKPLEAAESSMRLSNTHKLEHAYRQADEIKVFLRSK
jgi:hypothetical protein